jgi:hypothetical protein
MRPNHHISQVTTDKPLAGFRAEQSPRVVDCGAAALVLAHQRQHGEGNDPVGVSRRMQLRHAAMGSSPTPL